MCVRVCVCVRVWVRAQGHTIPETVTLALVGEGSTKSVAVKMLPQRNRCWLAQRPPLRDRGKKRT